MTLAHPLRGTCVPACELYGWCHCLCGRRTSSSDRSNRAEGATFGQPRVYVRDHHKRSPKNSRAGMPVRAILGDLRTLISLHGTHRRVATLLNHSPSWVSKVMNGHVRHIPLSVAQQIAVLARGTRQQATLDRKRERNRKTQAIRRHAEKPLPICECGSRILTDWDKCAACRAKSMRSANPETRRENTRRWGSGRMPIQETVA